MKGFIKKYILLLFLSLGMINLALALPQGDQDLRKSSKVEMDKSIVEEMQGDLEYDTDRKPEQAEKEEPEEEESENRRSSSSRDYSPWSIGSGAGGVMKVIMYVLVIGGLGFFIVKVLSANAGDLSNKKVKRTAKLKSLEELHPDEMEYGELSGLLKEFQEAGEFRNAVRVYFLILIKSLSENYLIKWEKRKTNSVYLREIRQKQLKPSFKELIRVFEWVWYGKHDVDAQQYDRISLGFQQFINQVKRSAREE